VKYAKIKPVDVSNGLGVRVSVFVSGCGHRCEGCFNSELWDFSAGQKFDGDVIQNIMNLCSESYISGLSILGGEPLHPRNLMRVTTLCYAFKHRFPNKDIWCYTGYDWELVKQVSAMKYIDVLVDGKFVQDLKDPRLKFRGSSNQRIIDVQKSRESGKLYLRKDLM
jgi:anaerobic ribonucleoside-triphosphate reductase activating protein